MTIVWAGHRCRLKGLTLFGLIEALSRRPNEFVPYDRLLKEVWGGNKKSDFTIRSSIRHLKAQLRHAGMPKLAESIKAGGRRYGLIFDD
jgi:DNA-binding winged helix-turn-helix (wHTH) protein